MDKQIRSEVFTSAFSDQSRVSRDSLVYKKLALNLVFRRQREKIVNRSHACVNVQREYFFVVFLASPGAFEACANTSSACPQTYDWMAIWVSTFFVGT